MKIQKNTKEAAVFLLPAVIIIMLLVILPIGVTFVYSLHRYKMTSPNDTVFIGLGNYKSILSSSLFWDSVINTIVIMLVVVVLGFIVSLLISLLLNKNMKISGLLTAIAIIPWALPPIVNGVVWQFVFDADNGLIYKILSILNIVDEPIGILSDRYASLVAIGIIVAWRVIPFCAILFLANLKSISPEIYEAARVDGAGRLNTFFHITFPLLIPSAIIAITSLTMNAVNVFDEVVSLVEYRELGAPLLIYNYNETFSYLNFGLGSAISYTIMIMSGFIGYFYIRGMNPSAEKEAANE